MNFRFHILRVGKDIVPYKPIASRIRSKSLKQINSSEDNEYMEFLNTLLTPKDVTPSSIKALSTPSSSSGSSIIRMVQDSPDSPDTVLPGSTSSSCLIDERLSQESSQSSQSCLLLDSASSSHENVIQALPGYTTVINEDVQVSKLLCFYP